MASKHTASWELNSKWAAELYADRIMFDINSYIEYFSERSHRVPMSEDLPSVADKEKTSGQIPNR